MAMHDQWRPRGPARAPPPAAATLAFKVFQSPSPLTGNVLDGRAEADQHISEAAHHVEFAQALGYKGEMPQTYVDRCEHEFDDTTNWCTLPSSMGEHGCVALGVGYVLYAQRALELAGAGHLGKATQAVFFLRKDVHTGSVTKLY